MKVKIKQCNTGWYKNKIGEIYEVDGEYNVQSDGNKYYHLSHNRLMVISVDDCELIPNQEEWLTEEQFIKIDSLIWRMCHDSLDARIKVAKQRGWIKQSKTAKQDLEEFYEEVKSEHEDGYRTTAMINFDKLFSKAIKAINEEAEKK